MSASLKLEPANVEQIEDARYAGQALARTLGFAVFPVQDDKRPFPSSNGLKDASKDAGIIQALWAKWPGPLIGVATGETSGIDVLDIDTGHELAAKWFTAARKKIPPTRAYATRRGGHHLYFRHGDGVRNSQSKLAHGVDIRGDGGYVVCWFAAGFACEDHAPPAPWPDWLLECVVWKPQPAPLVVTRSDKPEHAERAIEGALRVLKECKEGERNKVLHWTACRLGERVKAGEVSRGEANNRLLEAARSIGLKDAEAQTTINSAFRRQA